MSEQMVVTLVILAIVVVILVMQVVLVGRGKGPAAGMAVCRKCGRIFERSFFGLNLVTGKLVRCPQCGAWAILPAASPAELDAARAREPGSGPEVISAPTGEREALRRRIEQSKYEQ
jgi:hypothetical protein